MNQHYAVIREVLRGPYTCDVEVKRDGEWQRCGRVPVGLRRRPSNMPCPVCAFHARSYMVPLSEIVAALREDDPT